MKLATQLERVARRLEPPFPDEIIALIEAADAVTGDADLEPSLGWTESLAFGTGDDLELDRSDYEYEPEDSFRVRAAELGWERAIVRG
ncbi:hypothetical protein FKB34_11345 [Glycocaulis profundi]|nr:hypothetical protein FKB34_11345 [Glycocaulis profundi]